MNRLSLWQKKSPAQPENNQNNAGGREVIPPSPQQLKLNLRQRLSLRLKSYVYLGHYRYNGWRGSLPFYAFKCKHHGLQVNYPHGHEEKLTCYECFILVSNKAGLEESK